MKNSVLRGAYIAARHPPCEKVGLKNRCGGRPGGTQGAWEANRKLWQKESLQCGFRARYSTVNRRFTPSGSVPPPQHPFIRDLGRTSHSGEVKIILYLIITIDK